MEVENAVAAETDMKNVAVVADTETEKVVADTETEKVVADTETERVVVAADTERGGGGVHKGARHLETLGQEIGEVGRDHQFGIRGGDVAIGNRDNGGT